MRRVVTAAVAALLLIGCSGGRQGQPAERTDATSVLANDGTIDQAEARDIADEIEATYGFRPRAIASAFDDIADLGCAATKEMTSYWMFAQVLAYILDRDLGPFRPEDIADITLIVSERACLDDVRAARARWS